MNRGDEEVSLPNRDPLLNEWRADVLYNMLPSGLVMRDPRIVYNSLQHGGSLQTLYRMVKGKKPVALVVEDSGGAIFGAFMRLGIYINKPSSEPYGTGECFVFQLSPNPSVYRWSKKDEAFAVGNSDMLMIGGGSGFALQLSKDLSKGTSQRSDTYANEPLASSEQFRVIRVEVYSLGRFE